MSIRDWFERIKCIDFDEDFNELFSKISPSNIRLQCIRTLFQTEINYLKKIRDLLSTINMLFNKFTFKSLLTKSEFLFFYQLFPTIFDLHYALHLELIKEFKSSQSIGKVLIKHLVKPELSEVYLKYVDNCAEYKHLCNYVNNQGLSIKNPSLLTLESIVMMPIQRFPQLHCVISDIYKKTFDTNHERVDLYRVMCIIKSISMSLDKRQQIVESNEISEIRNCMKQIKTPIKSRKIMFKSSVYYLKPNFNIPRKLIKLPYILILCDSEIIIYPKNYPLNEVPSEMIFYYSLADTNISIKNIFRFSIEKNSQYEFQKAKELFPLIKDSFINDKILIEVEEILNDFNIINKIFDEVKNLNFRYNSIDQVKLSRSLLTLQIKLNEKERELNNYFASIINLTMTESGSVKDNKMFQFDSARFATEWKINFHRIKFSMGLDESINWLLTTKQDIFQLSSKEEAFPLLFPPYDLQNNGIINMKLNVINCQVITIVIGSKISRCLWLSMSDGYVVILHFNYKEWIVLESFPTKIDGPISNLCNYSIFDSCIADIKIDIEIWMMYKNEIISHSLLHNQRSVEKYRISLRKEGAAICQVKEKMFIGLHPNEIAIYSKSSYSQWCLESLIFMNKCLMSLEENIQNLIFDNELILYVVCDREIILVDVSDDKNVPIKIFTANENITCFNYSSDGIWIATSKDMTLTLYDKNLNTVLQTLSIPVSYFGKCTYDSIIAVILTDKYLWIGTEAGYIMIISTVNRLFCVDSIITTYLHSNFSCAPINILLPFQNVHGYRLKNKYQIDFSKRNISDIPNVQLKRSNSSPCSVETTKLANISSSDEEQLQELRDEVDSKNNYTFDYIKNNTPLFIITFGNGLLKFSDFAKFGCEHPRKKELFLLTFLE